MDLFRSLFIWWNKQTLATNIYTYFRGSFIGVDDLGNKYYTSFNKKKRWVIYERENFASELSIDWHGWLHWTTDVIPMKSNKTKNSRNKVFVRMDREEFNRNFIKSGCEQSYKPWIPK